MTRNLAILGALFLATSIYAVERSGKEPRDPNPTEIEKAESAVAASPSKHEDVLSAENRSVRELKVEVAAGGALKVDLEGRFQHALVLKIAPDGSRSIECIDDHREERALLESEPDGSADEKPKED